MILDNLKTYLFLLRTFRNGFAMIQNLRHGGYLSQGPVLDNVVFWNGKRIVHPPQRGGFLPIVLEMWRQNVYRIGEFYVPKPGDVVLDVGAHVGLFTIRILTAEPQCRVIAVEPSPENFDCLQKNIAMLDSSANVRVCQLGVGGSYGKIKMMDIPTN